MQVDFYQLGRTPLEQVIAYALDESNAPAKQPRAS